MNQSEFNTIVENTVTSIKRLLLVKGGEYAGSDDRLANFKRGAQLTGVHPLQVLFIYLSKHYDAVATFVRDTSSGSSRELSEPIEGRLDDIINYCLLAKALIKETREIAHVEGLVQARSSIPPAPVPADVSSGNDRLDDDRVWHSPPHTGTGVPAFRDIHDADRPHSHNRDLHRR